MYEPKFTVTNIKVPTAKDTPDSLEIFEYPTLDVARDAWHSMCASDHAYALQGDIKHYVCYVSDTNGNAHGLSEAWSEPEPNTEG